MIRLMHLIPRYINDGTCRMLNALIKYADRQRYQIYVGILSKDDQSLDRLREMGAIPLQFEMRHFADFSVIGALVEELSSRRIQILHTHRIRPDIIGRIAGHRAGVPINVSTQHHVGEWDERGKLIGLAVRLLYKRTLPYTQKVINISTMEMELMKVRDISPDKLEVIHNGVDSEIFSPLEEERGDRPADSYREAPSIGTVAYLTKRKGIAYLVSALREVADHFPEVQLKIIGDGVERSSLENQIRALDLQSNVELLGNRSDICSLLNSFDIFVLPSVWEPFGLVIAEAMACGKPVIATRVGGIPEIVVDGVTGLLVPPADAESLANAMLKLIRDLELRRNLGRAGRDRFLELFSARTMAAKYEALYERLISGGRSE